MAAVMSRGRIGAVTLGASVAACLGAVLTTADRQLSAALFALGMILAGTWLTLSILEWRGGDDDR